LVHAKTTQHCVKPIGNDPYLRWDCSSAADPGDKSLNDSAGGERARCDGQFDTGRKATEARRETCRGVGQQNTDRHFVADCGKASEFGTEFYGGEDSSEHGGAASRCGGSFGVED
jgi:hypothetical protein